MFVFRIVPALLVLLPGVVLAQGEDSTFFERDLAVVATLIEGGFSNANQSYFDVRGEHEVRHRRLHADVNRIDAPALGADVFVASLYRDNDESEVAGDFLWVLTADSEAGSVRMRSFKLEKQFAADATLSGEALNELARCDIFWRREAAQFRGAPNADCDDDMPTGFLLSDRQLWMTWSAQEGGDYKMHRVREFECYADIPGVGGGRDEPYERYEGFRIHDQGDAVWFTSKEGRRLGISLFLVDWPINNYKGIFTRDSFVIYVSEEIDGERKEHGYAFTVADADRIGINLKWMLASCFMKSNKYETPYM